MKVPGIYRKVRGGCKVGSSRGTRRKSRHCGTVKGQGTEGLESSMTFENCQVRGTEESFWTREAVCLRKWGVCNEVLRFWQSTGHYEGRSEVMRKQDGTFQMSRTVSWAPVGLHEHHCACQNLQKVTRGARVRGSSQIFSDGWERARGLVVEAEGRTASFIWYEFERIRIFAERNRDFMEAMGNKNIPKSDNTLF